MAYDSDKYASMAAAAMNGLKLEDVADLIEDDEDAAAFSEMRADVRSGKHLEIPAADFL